MIAQMPQILTIFRDFVDFIEQMLIHLLYALMTISRDFKCVCMSVHTQVRVCVYTRNCHQLKSSGSGSTKIFTHHPRSAAHTLKCGYSSVGSSLPSLNDSMYIHLSTYCPFTDDSKIYTSSQFFFPKLHVCVCLLDISELILEYQKQTVIKLS